VVAVQINQEKKRKRKIWKQAIAKQIYLSYLMIGFGFV
jgi:hypothetical protein